MPAAEATDRPERWILTPSEHALVMDKNLANRLGFAMLLLFFRDQGRFPRRAADVDPAAVAVVAGRLAMDVPTDFPLPLTGRTVERHRAEIRARFGFREATVADAGDLESWLRDQVATCGGNPADLGALLAARCRALRIEPPTAERVGRIVRVAIRTHDKRFYADIRNRLTPQTRARLEALLRPAEDAEAPAAGTDRSSATAPAVLLWLRDGPGRPSLAGVQEELAKLTLIRAIALPAGLFDRVRPHDLERYRRRVAAEAPYELRRHPEPARLTWLAAFVHLRGRTLVDDLVDLLIETVHHIGARAERRVERELLGELRRVSGKPNLLFELAGASPARPDGTVREVVFPVAGEQTLRGSGQGRQGHGTRLPDDAAHGDPQLLQRPLPAHGAAAARHARVPLEQRPPSPGDRGAGPADPPCQ
jgi:hypothetical protein